MIANPDPWPAGVVSVGRYQHPEHGPRWMVRTSGDGRAGEAFARHLAERLRKPVWLDGWNRSVGE